MENKKGRLARKRKPYVQEWAARAHKLLRESERGGGDGGGGSGNGREGRIETVSMRSSR